MVRNPILIPIVAGAAWSYSGLSSPLPLERFIDFLSGAAGPCTLFVLGASLAEYELAGQPTEIASMTLAKLFVHPIIGWLLCTKVYTLEPMTTNVATMMAAVPAGAAVFTVA